MEAKKAAIGAERGEVTYRRKIQQEIEGSGKKEVDEEGRSHQPLLQEQILKSKRCKWKVLRQMLVLSPDLLTVRCWWVWASREHVHTGSWAPVQLLVEFDLWVLLSLSKCVFNAAVWFVLWTMSHFSRFDSPSLYVPYILCVRSMWESLRIFWFQYIPEA